MWLQMSSQHFINSSHSQKDHAERFVSMRVICINTWKISHAHSASEDSAVKVLGGAADLDVEVADAPEAVGDAGLALAQPVVVGDADKVNVVEELVLLGVQQLIKPLAATLLHALENKLHTQINRVEFYTRLDFYFTFRLTGTCIPSAW